MQSKNKPAPTVAERAHIETIKGQPCAICDAAGPSEAHEIKQGAWFTSIPLCGSCHRDEKFGIHGQKQAWIARNMTELDALNIALGRLFGEPINKREPVAKQFKPSTKIIPRRGFV